MGAFTARERSVAAANGATMWKRLPFALVPASFWVQEVRNANPLLLANLLRSHPPQNRLLRATLGRAPRPTGTAVVTFPVFTRALRRCDATQVPAMSSR